MYGSGAIYIRDVGGRYIGPTCGGYANAVVRYGIF